jgi:hypothetical protein
MTIPLLLTSGSPRMNLAISRLHAFVLDARQLWDNLPATPNHITDVLKSGVLTGYGRVPVRHSEGSDEVTLVKVAAKAQRSRVYYVWTPSGLHVLQSLRSIRVCVSAPHSYSQLL